MFTRLSSAGKEKKKKKGKGNRGWVLFSSRRWIRGKKKVEKGGGKRRGIREVLLASFSASLM